MTCWWVGGVSVDLVFGGPAGHVGETGRYLGAGSVGDVLGGAAVDDRAIIHHDEVICNLGGEMEIVAHEQHGESVVVLELFEEAND